MAAGFYETRGARGEIVELQWSGGECELEFPLFQRHPQLRVLSLADARLDVSTVAGILSTLHNLVTLDVSRTRRLFSSGVYIFSRSLPPNLEELIMRDVGLNPDAVHALQLPPKLRTLDLGNNCLRDVGASIIARWADTLRVLRLRSNGVGDDGAVALAQMVTVSRTLEELNLYDNEIDDAVDELALASATSPTLRVLDLGENCFSDVSTLVEAVMASRALVAVYVEGLDQHKIDDAFRMRSRLVLAGAATVVAPGDAPAQRFVRLDGDDSLKRRVFAFLG